MKQGQFSQEQIVAILQQAEKGEITIQVTCPRYFSPVAELDSRVF